MPADPNRFAQDLFAPLPDRYDRLAEWLSFGQNGQWRKAMISRVLPAKGVILDVASGTAGVAIQLATRSGARVIGVDLTTQMLSQGRRNVATAGMSDQISLVTGRAEQLPFPDASFDALTFTYLLRYVNDPQATLNELARVLKPGGKMASLEFCVPSRPGVAPGVVGLYPDGAADGGPAHRRFAMAAGRALPRPEHLQPLPQVSDRLDRAGMAAGWPDRCRHQGNEPGRRPGHVGNTSRWLTPAAPGRPTMRRGRAAGGTGGRCCTRRTPRGTCPMR